MISDVTPGPIRSDNQSYCEHVFFQAPLYAEAKEGDDVWFYCERCLLLIKKNLIDQSDKL